MINKQLSNVVITGFGYKIKKKGRLIVIQCDGENVYISPREIKQLVIAGEVLFTSGAIALLIDHAVEILFLSQNPRISARVMNIMGDRCIDIWRKQIEISYYDRIIYAKEFVNCGIYNKIRLLQQIVRNRDISFSAEIDLMNNLKKKISDADSIAGLMGLEGHASKVYFSCIKVIVPSDFKFEKRIRHPPKDPINSMLSYGYMMLFSKVNQYLIQAGLNVYIGFLHESYRDRAALSFDLMEEYRQPIVDRVVLTFMAHDMLKLSDFKIGDNTCIINDDLKRKFVDALYSRLEQKYNYKNELKSFKDIIFLQAKNLSKSIRKNSSYEGFCYR